MTIRPVSGLRQGLGSYSGLVEIPLNPPLSKGDFDSPLRKRGAGGGFLCFGVAVPGMGVSMKIKSNNQLIKRRGK
jgi:hypothetical protein